MGLCLITPLSLSSFEAAGEVLRQGASGRALPYDSLGKASVLLFRECSGGLLVEGGRGVQVRN